MQVIKKYYLSEYFRYLAVGLIGMALLFVLMDFIGEFDDFIQKKPPLTLILAYLILRLPKFVLFILPMASLFSVLLVIGISSKWKEIIAIKAMGGSLKKFFSIFLVIGAILTLFSFVMNETITPIATSKAREIRYKKILHKREKVMFKDGELWLRGLKGDLVHFKDFVFDKGIGYNVSIFQFNSYFEPLQIMEVKQAIWKETHWELRGVASYDPAGQVPTWQNSMIYKNLDAPEILVREQKRPEEMNFFEVLDYYNELRATGYRDINYEVDIYSKLTLPFINFVMMLFGLALSLRNTSASSSGLKAMGSGALIIILYWALYSGSLSLGYAEQLPPWFAPWISPLLFGLGGAYLYVGIEE